MAFMCVGNDDDVREVAEGPRGALEGLRPGALLVDHTTASAGLARELEQHATARGLGFLDAPVSGGQAGAVNGRLTVMVGGDQASFRTAEPVMRHYGQAVRLMGPAGSGQLTKMVNQIILAGILQGLAEGLNFAVRAGLDANQVAAVLSKTGAARVVRSFENRARTMIEGKFDFGFAVDWMRKDLAIGLEEARRNGSALPVAALVDQLYQQVQARGGSRWDTSKLSSSSSQLREPRVVVEPWASRGRAVGLVHELLLVASHAMPLTPEAHAGRTWSEQGASDERSRTAQRGPDGCCASERASWARPWPATHRRRAAHDGMGSVTRGDGGALRRRRTGGGFGERGRPECPGGDHHASDGGGRDFGPLRRWRRPRRFAEGAVWAQMGTIGVTATTQIAGRLAELRPDVMFVDAPVSGSKGAALSVQLLILGS